VIGMGYGNRKVTGYRQQAIAEKATAKAKPL
jgi:hypothetical protein